MHMVLVTNKIPVLKERAGEPLKNSKRSRGMQRKDKVDDKKEGLRLYILNK